MVEATAAVENDEISKPQSLRAKSGIKDAHGKTMRCETGEKLGGL